MLKIVLLHTLTGLSKMALSPALFVLEFEGLEPLVKRLMHVVVYIRKMYILKFVLLVSFTIFPRLGLPKSNNAMDWVYQKNDEKNIYTARSGSKSSNTTSCPHEMTYPLGRAYQKPAREMEALPKNVALRRANAVLIELHLFGQLLLQARNGLVVVREHKCPRSG